jgi:hypothetical protein
MSGSNGKGADMAPRRHVAIKDGIEDTGREHYSQCSNQSADVRNTRNCIALSPNLGRFRKEPDQVWKRNLEPPPCRI